MLSHKAEEAAFKNYNPHRNSLNKQVKQDSLQTADVNCLVLGLTVSHCRS